MPVIFLSFGLGPVAALGKDIGIAKKAAAEIFHLLDRVPDVNLEAQARVWAYCACHPSLRPPVESVCSL